MKSDSQKVIFPRNKGIRYVKNFFGQIALMDAIPPESDFLPRSRNIS